ncbi:MAG: cysteine synthase A [Coriobacteriales bacterium]|jgi:cysteine synthase A|nr:cysteine synthase A [Coriobacteriales bacterium]
MSLANLPANIGNTPLVNLSNVEKTLSLSARIYGKLEADNPAGSVKDRVAWAMIEAAERTGILRPDSTIIEPTSGNTGIALAAIGVAKGFRVILTMPDSMSMERRQLLVDYGAELVLTPGNLGMQGAIDQAEVLTKQISGAFLPGQFTNPVNPLAHYQGTGPEIWHGLAGRLDYFVAGVGTGGTVTGAGRYLKEQDPAIQVIAVEPAESAVLSGSQPHPHGIQGIGAGFVPEILDIKLIDEVITVDTDNAIATCRLIAKAENLLVGISSGAAVWAAIQLAQKPENCDRVIVVVLPDGGDRYLSAGLFED